MLGSGYVVDCCIAAINSSIRRQNWENYIADAAAAVVNMLAGGNKMPRYWDLIHEKPREERSADEIILDIIQKHGLKVVS